MERELGNEDRKEKQQHERSTAEEPERDTRGVRPEESPQMPKETATEKSEGENERKTEALLENQEGREEQGNLQGRHQQQEPEGLQPNERPTARAERGPAWERPEERDQGQGIRGRTPKQRKHKRQISGRKTTRRKRTPHRKEARRPRRTRRKREQGG